MGTRADFYVGRGEHAEWLGSVAYDGYPEGLFPTPVEPSWTEAAWRAHVATLLDRSDGTRPADGWPWPWEDSRTTDFAYAFDDGAVWVSSFGRQWVALQDWNGRAGDGPKTATFPDMTARQNVTYGPRSGVLILGFDK